MYTLLVHNILCLLVIIFLGYFHEDFAEYFSHKITEVRFNRHHIRYFAEQYDYRKYENVTCVFFRIFALTMVLALLW